MKLVQGTGRSGLADPAGAEYAAAAGDVSGRLLVGRQPLGLAHVGVSAAVLLGLAAGAQNFWVFVKERLDRSKKDKPRRTGFNSHL